jgi:biopolymer transport protein ExbB
MLQFMIDGGWCMWPILLCSVIALGIYLERRQVIKEAEIDADGLLDDISGKVSTGDLDGAVETAEAAPGPVAATLAVGLRKMRFLTSLGKKPDEIEAGVNKAMEDHGASVIDHLERNLPLLATMAAMAPLIGMLGTVVGLIDAFSAIMQAGNVRPDKVAGGISVALLTTAAGLIVAVPATLFYNTLVAQVNRVVLKVQSTGTELVEELMAIHADPGGR